MIEYILLAITISILISSTLIILIIIKDSQTNQRKLIDRLIAKSLNEVKEIETPTSDPPPPDFVQSFEDLKPVGELSQEDFDKMIKKSVSPGSNPSKESLIDKAKQKLGR